MIQNKENNHIINWKYLGVILMKKTVIGITARLVDGSYKVSSNLIAKICNLGCLPYIILPGLESELPDILKKCQGFIIPGGNSWHNTDEIIIKYAINEDIPLMGICAGMQAICNLNNFCGGPESDQTIPILTKNHHSLEEYHHNILITSDFLKNIIHQDKIKVNSRHNFTVTKEDYFVIDALSEDNIIEAIHLPKNRYIVGFQWHPEDLNDAAAAKIFQNFIEQVKNS